MNKRVFAGAIRPSSPVIVISLLILIAAFALSTLGNAKGNVKTIIGAVFYVIAGLYSVMKNTLMLKLYIYGIQGLKSKITTCPLMRSSFFFNFNYNTLSCGVI